MSNNLDNCYNLNELTATEIAGKYWSQQHLKRILVAKGVEGKAGGDRRSKYYNLDEVKVAVEEWMAYKGKELSTTKSANISKLKETKLLKEIEMLRANISKAETATKISTIQLDNLKKTSVPAEEVKEFLLLRYGIENAILRQILFVNAPIELMAMTDIAKARDKCEEYYNQIQDVLHETLLVWQQKCLADEEGKEWPPKIQKVINELTESLSNAGKDNTTNE